MLKRLGHPAVLALRYQQGRCLIGPAIFPIYWFAVKFVLGVLAVVHILLPAIFLLVTGEPAGKIEGLFLRYPGVALPVLAWMTIGFAVLDTAPVRSRVEGALSGWSPRSLPPVMEGEPDRPPSVTGLVLSALSSVWWLVGLQIPPVLLGPAAGYIAFGPIFYQLYVPMVVAAAAGIVLGWIRLARPHFTQLHRLGGMAVDALGLVILYLLFRGGDWIVAGERMSTAPGFDRVIEVANLGMSIALTIGLVAAGISFSWKHLIRPVCRRRGFLTRTMV